MAEQAPEGAFQVPAVWVGVEDLPIQFINQVVAVVQPDEVFLTLGAVSPPPILGDTEEERRAQVESIQFVQVKPVARVAMTPAQLERLIEVLQETRSNYEKLMESQK